MLAGLSLADPEERTAAASAEEGRDITPPVEATKRQAQVATGATTVGPGAPALRASKLVRLVVRPTDTARTTARRQLGEEGAPAAANAQHERQGAGPTSGTPTGAAPGVAPPDSAKAPGLARGHLALSQA